MNASELIQQLIQDKSTATPQDVAAAIAVNPRFVADNESLRRLSEVTKFSELHLVDVHGSIHFGSFRPDWSCDCWGYGYKSIVEDIRKGLFAKCDCGARLYLSERVRH